MQLSVLALIRSDARANRKNPKGFLLCFLYRVTHGVLSWPRFVRPFGYAIVLLYKFVTEYILGSEIHWRATIGPGLHISHGYGLVVHSDTIIGSDCTLRQGVTIGIKSLHDMRAPVIGNRVNFGAAAMVIGSYTIGDDVTLGAGTVVVRDIPSGSTAVGNPGRILQHD